MQNKMPLPVTKISPDVCRNLKFFFTDIDDTLSEGGLLPDYSYNALWKLHNNKINVVPVTGRPAGWCDHIARMWPVMGVIGENGSFYFSYNRDTKKMIRKYLLSEKDINEGKKKLDKLRDRILKKIKNSRIAADQPYRITDLAIDFCEDLKIPLTKDEIERICQIIEEHKATYKISSIHINCWYGDFNKISCVKTFLRDFSKDSFNNLQDQILFIGDSPNDEPMFKELKYTIAVHNITMFIDQLKYHPKYITKRNSAMGFCEAVDEILKNRMYTDH